MNEEARQRFQKWADNQKYGYPFPLELARIGNDYKYADTRFAWLAYQAGSDDIKEKAAQAIKKHFATGDTRSEPLLAAIRALE